jgi:WhiB family transcriptional regulator, redox-sensing transcriptional regulator
MSTENHPRNRPRCADEDPELFFPYSKSQDDIMTRMAKKVCSQCLVSDACLSYALDDPDIQGIWGGTTEGERRRMRFRRKLGNASLTELYAELEKFDSDEQIA